ncbi:spermidine hydroxycinnamoyl transferase-like [Telopea speciosissima]|uniref:spermidine hydroxycinnamoyl transferase-like n=1 Tax=Telopea speciosissima TaxID=54955 RepID=UPI001CC62B04|nr:spermidine hydroxycinnamoyl transferase-like [Telopea speciosissima]
MVILKGSHTVTPAQPTSSGKLWLSESDQVKPLTHAPTIYFYRPTSSDVSITSADIDTLRDSLSKVLVQFYPLAGRLHWIGGGRLELDCNAAGAKLFEAESDASIVDFGDFRPTPEIRELIPRIDYNTPINELPLLLVQLTRLCCGGIAVGVAISHVIVDGQTALQFINTWAKVARGEKLETTVFLDRTVLHTSESPSAPRFDHVEFKQPPVLLGRSDASEERKKETTVVMLKLTRDQVEKLKCKANESRTEESGRAFSRYEAVAGHMWRCACKARAHEPEQLTKLRIVVDCRNRLRPPLPQGYFGNATFPTTPTSLAGELLAKPLGYASGKIREAVEKVNDEYVRSTIDFLKSQEDLTPFRTSFHTVGCTQGVFFGNPNLAVTSWVGLPIYDADFGWGKPIHMGPGSLGFDGKSFILPGREGDGSFIVALRLQVPHIDDFEKIFYEDIRVVVVVWKWWWGGSSNGDGGGGGSDGDGGGCGGGDGSGGDSCGAVVVAGGDGDVVVTWK